MTVTPTNGYGRLAVICASFGGGGAVFYSLIEMLRAQPQSAALVITTLGQWGPMFALAAGIVVVGSRGANRVVDVLQQTATANQSLADAVNRIAQKDDIAARERELLLDHIAFTMREVKSSVERIEGRQTGSALGAAGGA